MVLSGFMFTSKAKREYIDRMIYKKKYFHIRKLFIR